METRYPQAGIDIIKHAESLQLTAYDCPAGIRTIGYGHTGGDFPDTITEEQADVYLVRDCHDASRAVSQMVEVPLTDNQYGALLSFVFNLGSGNFKRSTLLKKLNAEDYDGAADELLRWNKSRVNGELIELRGLTIRRQAERELFLTKEGN